MSPQQTQQASKKASFIITLKNMALEIGPVLNVFKKYGIEVTHLESRKSRQGNDQSELASDLLVEMEVKTIIESFSKVVNEIREALGSPESVKVISRPADKFIKSRSLNLGDTKYTSDGYPWFPKYIQDLDECSNRVLMYGAELDADHPGFKDEEYRKRRIMFAEIAYNYRHGQPIPRVEYNEEETKTWKTIYTELTKLYPTHACKEYLENFPLLEKHCGYGPDHIPQLEDISSYLKQKTGFQLRPVAGYLSSRDFLAGLAYRVFYCTQYIRHGSDPFYTPEPDCCHEILGHMPLFLNSSFAEFSQQIGIASLGASDEYVQKLATCYFFTIEFGLCKQDGAMRVYGAGLLSSIGELKHVLSGSAIHKALEIQEVCETECMITTFQHAYFYTDSFEEAKEKLKQFAKQIDKPFDLDYDPYVQSMKILFPMKSVTHNLKIIEERLDSLKKSLKKLPGFA